MSDDRLDGLARAVAALTPALDGVEKDGDGPVGAAVRAAVSRGYFTPAEDDCLRSWFARYLTLRGGLLETIEELRPAALDGSGERRQLTSFLIAYCAACQLVRAARYLVERFAAEPLVQRKLNEADPRRRVPRKQYTAVYRSLTRPVNAWRLGAARRFAEDNRDVLAALARDDPALATVFAAMTTAERALDVSRSRYVRARLRFRRHSLLRRRASAAQQSTYAVFEAFGRVIAEMRPGWRRDRVRPGIRRRLAAMLQPGDILVTRHDNALSNLFLPGYWPHVALHIGLADTTRRRYPIDLSAIHVSRWVDPMRVLEARKDGVLFRPIDDTLAVDSVAVLRPNVDQAAITEALGRAISHEGKLYDFDFDFFRSDCLVCTEVVYRGFEGVGGLQIPLTSRAGRPTLSAEDLISLAIDGRGFEPIAVYGTPASGRRIATGAAARAALEKMRGLGI